MRFSALTAAALSLALVAGLPAAAQTPAGRAAAMPVRELPAASNTGDTLAIFYSGDGGWAALDQAVTSRIAAAGVPVVGVNSLTYFLPGRSAEDAAADLADLVETYAAKWGKHRVILAGFSFGADALPAIIPRLPAQVRSKVRSLAMVGAERQGELKFQPGDWVGKVAKNAFPIAPLLTQLSGLPTVCIYGADDPRAGCADFPAHVRSVKLSGDHHLGKAYDDIAKAILSAG